MRMASGSLLLLLYLFAITNVVVAEYHHSTHIQKAAVFHDIHEDLLDNKLGECHQCTHLEVTEEKCELCIANIIPVILLKDLSFKDFSQNEYAPLLIRAIPLSNKNSKYVKRLRGPPVFIV